MFGFSKKKQDPPENASRLIVAEGFKIELVTVISTSEHMIVRVKLSIPFYDERNFEVVARDESGNRVSLKSIFMGKGECTRKVNGVCIFRELMFSVFVPYPEKNLVFSILESNDETIIHEQLFAENHLSNLRRGQDDVFYKFALNDPYYDQWFEENKATQTELDLQKKMKLENEPKFSIVVPLFKTNVAYFEELLGSIKAQTYSNWELILVNGSVEDSELKKHVDAECDEDERIKKIELEKNEGITLNTAQGIRSCEGDFVCFVDHDDVIEPNVLFEYAQKINEVPDTELLYCDEDKLFADGHKSEVYFKPDFSLHLLRSNNYVCHMLCIKRDLLMTLDFDDKQFDGAQDHHLTLQVAEKTKNVAHVPKVLYHWRVTESSTSGGSSAKPYAQNATKLAVSAHLKRVGVEAEVEPHPTIPSTTQVKYALPSNNPKVSIIIPNKDQVALLKCCIDSILGKTTYQNYELLIIENNSEEDETFNYYEPLKSLQNVHVHKFEGEFNFSKIMNFGRSKATGDYLLLLNNDTEIITENWIENMLGVCSQPEVGIVGCKLLFPDDTIQHAGILVADLPYHFFHHLPNGAINYMNFADVEREVSAVTAACMMVKAETFDEVGGFDEELQVSYNDVDFCFKVREAGKSVVYEPFVKLHHYESISRGHDVDPKAQARLVTEKGKMLVNWTRYFSSSDPYFTPNIAMRWQAAYYSF